MNSYIQISVSECPIITSRINIFYKIIENKLITYLKNVYSFSKLIVTIIKKARGTDISLEVSSRPTTKTKAIWNYDIMQWRTQKQEASYLFAISGEVCFNVTTFEARSNGSISRLLLQLW